MLTLDAVTNQAVQTIHQCQLNARQLIWEVHIFGNNKDNEEYQKIFLANNNPLETYWKKTNHYLTHTFLQTRNYTDMKEYNEEMQGDYEPCFMNHLNNVIFGVNTYRAMTQQKKYMDNYIVKPFEHNNIQ